MNKLKDIEDITVNFNKENISYLVIHQCVEHVRFLKRMLDIANEILQLPIKK